MKKLACNKYFSAKVQQIFQARNDKEIIFMDIPYIIIFIVIIVIIVLIINVMIIIVITIVIIIVIIVSIRREEAH